VHDARSDGPRRPATADEGPGAQGRGRGRVRDGPDSAAAALVAANSALAAGDLDRAASWPPAI
jgi:hypothetical protein